MIRLMLYSMQSHVLNYTSGDVSHEHYTDVDENLRHTNSSHTAFFPYLYEGCKLKRNIFCISYLRIVSLKEKCKQLSALEFCS